VYICFGIELDKRVWGAGTPREGKRAKGLGKGLKPRETKSNIKLI